MTLADSCAGSENFAVNRMWPDRRRMQVLLLPTCAPSARLLRLALWSEATRLGLWSEETGRRVRNEIRRRRLGVRVNRSSRICEFPKPVAERARPPS